MSTSVAIASKPFSAGRSRCLGLGTYVTVFAVAVGVRLAALHFIHWPVVSDLFWNDQAALNMLQGHGFTATAAAPYTPGIFRTPGYPAFLAAVYAVFGHSYKAALIAQAVVDAATAVLISATAARVTRPTLGVICGVLYGVYPYSAALCAMLHQDVLLTFTIALTLWATVIAQSSPQRLSRWAWVGVALGASVLVKPILLAYAAIPLGVIAAARAPVTMKLAATGVLIAAILACLAPWVIRNYVVFREFPLLASGTPADAGLGTLVDELEKPGGAIAYEVPQMDILETREQYLGKFIDGKELIEATKKARSENLRTLKADWKKWAAATITHIPRLWVSRQSRYQLGLMSYLLVIFSAAAMLAGIFGMLVAWEMRRDLVAAYLTIAVITLAYAPLHVESRYTLPARPVLLLFIAILLDRARAAFVSYKNRGEQPVTSNSLSSPRNEISRAVRLV